MIANGKYKVHPKMHQIQEQKLRLRLLLNNAKEKEEKQLLILKRDRKEYMEDNKEQIISKQKAIFEKKLEKRNKIREEDLTRGERIANKKSELLLKLIPERRELIQNLRKEYLQSIAKQDQRRKEQLQKHIRERVELESEKLRQTLNWQKKQQKIKQNNIIDINDGICVICLNAQAEFYMIKCRHLVCCKDCQFMIRMMKKCALCRCQSSYKSIRELMRNKKQYSSMNKNIKKNDMIF